MPLLWVPALLFLVLAFSSSSEAGTIIDTTKSHGSAWHGISEGPGPCEGFGQTFVVPEKDTLLVSFTFWLDDYLNPGRHHELDEVDSYLDFGAYVMEWCPKTEETIGTVLWESGQRTTTNNHGAGGMEKFTFDTGGVQLKPGAHYVVFLGATHFFDGVPGGAMVATYWDRDTDNRNPYPAGSWVAQTKTSYPVVGKWVRHTDWDAAVRIVLVDPDEEP